MAWEDSYIPVRPVHSLGAQYVVAKVVLGECTITAMFRCSVGPGMLDMFQSLALGVASGLREVYTCN